MLSPRITPTPNRLLAALPKADRKRLISNCETVTLLGAESLAAPGEHIRHVYFPTDSFISQAPAVDGYSHFDVGLIGDEGMLGMPLLFGVAVAQLHARVQGAGPALRMDAASFRRELTKGAALERVLKRYAHVMMGQMAQAAACCRFHLVEARLARLLLMSRDRSHSDAFRITHEFLAYMLGVRRAGVSTAAGSLQRRRLIRYRRGALTIVDGPGLETVSCECYALDKAAYAQGMAPCAVKQAG